MNFATIFLLTWSTCSVSEKRMLLLPVFSTEFNFNLFEGLRVKLLFSGFDTSRFHNFFYF